jgi:hypothetical protein
LTAARPVAGTTPATAAAAIRAATGKPPHRAM